MARDNEPGMRRTNGQRAGGSGKWSKYRAGSRSDKRFSWSGVDSSIILDAVVSVTAGGAAIMFGQTRDGGCGVVTVCDGDDRLKLYGNSVEQMEEELRQLHEFAFEPDATE